jgi:hypothetical protein
MIGAGIFACSWVDLGGCLGDGNLLIPTIALVCQVSYIIRDNCYAYSNSGASLCS